MIFYFTGTGNSGYVAKELAKADDDKLISIAEVFNKQKDQLEITYSLKDGEKIGFVCPIYAWYPPKMVLDFISKLKFTNYKDNYVFAVVTCGENIGNSMKVFESSLSNKGLKLMSGFSVIMPNNYLFMGADVDSKEVQNGKLENAKEQLKEITKVINNEEKDVFKVVKGPMPGFLATAMNPFFSKYAINTSKFYATDGCTGCKVCEKVCNTNTITVDKKPKWGKECTQCMACINNCPVNAIQYGKGTIKKGRYKNPYFR